jgi:uncharacterized membrane-anchored protein
MDSNEVQLRQRTRRRFLFTGLHLCLYFSFSLNWTAWGDAFANRLGATYVTGALLMFIALILIFIALESVFLWLSRRGEQA